MPESRTPAELLAAVTELRAQADVPPGADTTESRVFDRMEVLAHLDDIGQAGLLPLLEAAVAQKAVQTHVASTCSFCDGGAGACTEYATLIRKRGELLNIALAAVDAALGAPE